MRDREGGREEEGDGCIVLCTGPTVMKKRQPVTLPLSYQCCSDVLLHYNEQFGGASVVHRTPCRLLCREGRQKQKVNAVPCIYTTENTSHDVRNRLSCAIVCTISKTHPNSQSFNVAFSFCTYPQLNFKHSPDVMVHLLQRELVLALLVSPFAALGGGLL